MRSSLILASQETNHFQSGLATHLQLTTNRPHLAVEVASVSGERTRIGSDRPGALNVEELQSQLAAQAEAIAILSRQRSLLLSEIGEMKARWEVERQGWDRSAEALIAQHGAAERYLRDQVRMPCGYNELLRAYLFDSS